MKQSIINHLAPLKNVVFALALIAAWTSSRASSTSTSSSDCNDTWTATSTTNTPSARYLATAVWSGSEMIVWGGNDNVTGDVNTGGRYNPITNSWIPTSSSNAPSDREGHTAVWTGTEMIVWGGEDVTGGRYNPITDSWIATSTANAPTAREYATAVWTGSEMIVWGGSSHPGGKYNPSTNSWTLTSTVNAPTGRLGHTAIWTGSEMIVWGGSDGVRQNTGGRYNPLTNSWTAISTTNAPTPRESHTAVWTGSEMIVWGGVGSQEFNTGGRYNPVTDSWTVTSTTNAPSARALQTAFWTGSEMIVWGGVAGVGNLNTGGRYNPNTDSWTATSTTNAANGKAYYAAVLTGREIIVWGGDEDLALVTTGGRYCAQPRIPITVSGTISYCSNPLAGPVAGVMLTSSGDFAGSTQSDGSGNYQFLSLPAGGTYTVTPTKSALPPASPGINTVDVVATQRHFLEITPLPPGCRLMAGDATGDGSISTADVVAIQRFYLGLTIGIANVGHYRFTPANLFYPSLGGYQTSQNYDALIIGDVAGPFASRTEGALQDAASESPATVATVRLPEVEVDQSRKTFTAAVTTSAIDENNNLVGFQGDFTFDQRVVTFASEPVQKAGLTGGNWNVSGNVLDGPGPIRTLRISAFSNDFAPLVGSGTLFTLKMTRRGTDQSTKLIWAAPPNGFVFIDADLRTQKAVYTAPGGITCWQRRQ